MTTEIDGIIGGRGLTRRTLADAAKVNLVFIHNLAAGQVPGNHPFLPRVAKALRVALDTLQIKAGCQNVPPMGEKQVKRVMTRWGGEEPSQRVRGVAIVHKPKRGRPANGVTTTRRYNKLKRLDDDARQVARALTMTANVAAMKGQRYVTLENVPTLALGRVLQRYLELEGVPDGAIVKVDFADVFG